MTQRRFAPVAAVLVSSLFLLAGQQAAPSGSYTAELEALRIIAARLEAEERAHPQERYFPPYAKRVPVQLRQATEDLLATGDVFRLVRSLRHALLPAMDREMDPRTVQRLR